jgi:[ribosomal protein S18]-alanine N-acetyltransferase
MSVLIDKLRNFIMYDADREFYAQVFPDSVTKSDLIRLRKMTRADLPSVMAIEKQNYDFPWSEDIFTDCFQAGYRCWVALSQDKVVGYCLMSLAVGEAHILNVSVDPNEQGQGIGRKMMESLIAYARGRAETMFLEVRPSNPVAITLYENLGFNEIGVRKAYYPAKDGREDAIMLALQIL